MSLVRRNLWMILLALGIMGFAVTWLFLPHKSEIETAWQLVFKLITYGFIIGSIAFFPNKSKHGYLLVILPFFIFLGLIIPKISYFGFTGVVPISDYSVSGEFYTVLYLLLVPMINFSVSFAYRMGGGTPGKTIKISLCGIIILFSGYLDVLWQLVNPVEIPDKLLYAHHITLILGRVATFREGIIFALCHIPLFIIAILLPLDKWIDSISAYFRRFEAPKFLNS